VIDLRLGRVPAAGPVEPGPAPSASAPAQPGAGGGSGAASGAPPQSPSPGAPTGNAAGHAPATPTVPAAGRDDPHDYYVVQPGDTLSSIAQKQLGSATKAEELVRLNRLADADGIVAGQVLRLR
jgi:LysM repeat protein